MNALAELACDLIARSSVTPDDKGCQLLLGERLSRSGFELETMNAGDVKNLWARRGKDSPLLCFAGHTDVVPAGPRSDWRTPPFEPVIVDGMLIGRGAADMKGALAAMTMAIERFVNEHPEHLGSIAVLLTSDEEGPAIDGTRVVVDKLTARGEHIDFCVVGEPSASKRSGDRIRVGRRGSLNVALTVRGSQRHVAYPEDGANPIHAALGLLEEIANHHWDSGADDFPPTHLQFTDLQAGVGASNVTPSLLSSRFNLRFSPASPATEIEARLRKMIDARRIDYVLECTLSGQPFYTPPGKLRSAAQDAVTEVCGFAAEESTGGGTSDGRFIAPTGCEVVELGPPGETLHKANEQVELAELERLVDIYVALMKRLLC